MPISRDMLLGCWPLGGTAAAAAQESCGPRIPATVNYGIDKEARETMNSKESIRAKLPPPPIRMPIVGVATLYPLNAFTYCLLAVIVTLLKPVLYRRYDVYINSDNPFFKNPSTIVHYISLSKKTQSAVYLPFREERK